MRKRNLSEKVRWIPGILGCAMIMCMAVGGCSSYRHPGETDVERKVRHTRLIRANYYQMIDDIDLLLGLDAPSTLSGKRIVP